MPQLSRVAYLLGSTRGSSSGATPAVADVLEFEVLGVTNFTPDGSSVGINTNGWAARVRVTDTGATFDPTKIVVNTSDPGYSGPNITTTRLRTLRGAELLRQQPLAATSGTAPVYSVDNGATIDYYITFLEPIWDATTIVSVEAEANFYGAAGAGTVPSLNVTQNSSLAYSKPVFGWFNKQHDRVTGTFRAEIWAMHESAILGQGVAGVEFIATDGTNTSATQSVSTPTLSTIQTKGQIAECYAADIPVSALDNQGTSATPGCKLGVKIYPHIGDSSAVLDITGASVDLTKIQTPLAFVNDKNGTYGGVYAYVDGIGGGTPAVSTTAATARTTPYASVQAAISGIATFNAGRGTAHSDHGGGIVRLMDVAASHAVGANVTTSSGASWLVIENDPLNTGSTYLDLNATRTITNGKWDIRCDVVRSAVANYNMTGGTGKMMAVSNNTVTLNAGNTTPWFNSADYVYQMNVTYPTAPASAGTHVASLSQNGANVQACMLALGILWQSTTVAQNIVPYVTIGCVGKLFPLTGGGSQPSNDNIIMVNNVWQDIETNAVDLIRPTLNYTGGAIVANVFEGTSSGGDSAMHIGGDSDTGAIANMIVAYNVFPGPASDVNAEYGRINHFYCDVAGAANVVKWGVFKFNASWRMATKTDYFAYNNGGGITGCTGNLVMAYGVRSEGNVMAFNRPIDPTGLEYFRRAKDANTAVNAGVIGFTTNNAGNGAAGFGNYRPTGGTGSVLYGRVGSGRAMLKYDLDGDIRATTAGPYEI